MKTTCFAVLLTVWFFGLKSLILFVSFLLLIYRRNLVYLHALAVHVNLLFACKKFCGLFVIPIGKWSDGWAVIRVDIG